MTMYRTYNSNIDNVHSYKPINSHLYIYESLNNTISNNYFNDAYYHHGCNEGHGYGVVLFNNSTLNLIENNIFRRHRVSIALSRGAHKNVLGYNYAREAYVQTGTTEPRNILSRTWYDSGNLIEGNRIDRLAADTYHNGESYKNVFLRNYTYFSHIRILGGEKTYLVGNKGKLTSDTDHSSFIEEVYAFYQNPFQGSFPISHQYNNSQSRIYDNNSSLSFISLYNSTLPNFFNQQDTWIGSYSWPAIGPPTSTNSNQPTQYIPALARYCEAYYDEPNGAGCESPTIGAKISNSDFSNEKFDENIEKINLSNYPNPFNPETTISFTLQKKSNIKLLIYNGIGQKISTLVDDKKSIGKHSIRFDARNLPSGIYHYQLLVNGQRITNKMLLIK